MSAPETSKPLIPVVLAGGGGQRLWPLSRAQMPKPLLKLDGPEQPCMLENTLTRARALTDDGGSGRGSGGRSGFRAVLVCNQEHASTILGLNCDWDGVHLLLAPAVRNTAAAVASAALYIERTWGDDNHIVLLPADHHIQPVGQLAEAVRQAGLRTAERGELVCIGIAPERPHTGYGYVGRSGTSAEGEFIEKPELARAEALLAGGEHLWNTGMYCSAVRPLLDAFAHCAPEVLKIVRDSLDDAEHRSAAIAPSVYLSERYIEAPEISFDRAVAERVPVQAVAGDFEWRDLGDWASVQAHRSGSSEAGGGDGDGDGDGDGGDGGGDGGGARRILLRQSENVHVHAEGRRLIAVLGLSDAVVVDTPDALLVLDSEHAQEVGSLVRELAETAPETVQRPMREMRPWGDFEVLLNAPGYKVKRIRIRPGQAISLQSHRHRSEHWTVVRGRAEVTLEAETHRLDAEQSIHIPIGKKHRLRNPDAEVMLEIIEVQTGDYLGEDDITRYEDLYGRDPKAS